MPSQPPSSDGRRLFIAAGTVQYPHLGASMALPSVATDLKRITDYFQSQGCIRALPDLGCDPDLADIRDQLPVWMQGEVTKDDIVAFYYSGHGCFDDRYYLLASNSQDGLLDTTAIPIEELARWLVKNSTARQIIIIIDACYAGRGINELVRIASKLAELLASSPCVFAIAAAGAKEEAQQGSFSEAFCDALANRDGRLGWRTQPYIFAEALIDAINERLERAELRQSVRLVASIRESCRLFPNPQYQASIPSSLDLQAQRDLIEHWIPKARGAELAGDSAWYFTGRQRALTEITRWLQNAHSDSRPRVITGRPGVGKSSFLSRLVTLSVPATRAEALRSVTDSRDVIPPEGAVQIAIHARRCSLQNVIDLVAARIGTTAGDAETLAAQFVGRDMVTIVIDAVDEALEPRLIIDSLLLPLSHLPNVRLLVGMRPDAPNGHVTAFGERVVEIDLGAPTYFEPADIITYARRRLGVAVRPDIMPPETRKRVVQEIAEKAGNNFLIARILCDSALLEQQPSVPAIAGMQEFTVSTAFADYLARFDAVPELGRVRATDLMVPLAFAEGEGLPWEVIWPQLAGALSGRLYAAADIAALFSHAGAYIVEANVEGRSVYRLYHEALAEYLRGLADQAMAQRTIAEALTALVPANPLSTGRDWHLAHPYTLRHLATHAVKAGQLEALLNDSEFLLHAASQTLAPALRTLPPGAAGGRAAAYLRAFPHMQQESLPARVQYLALAAALLGCRKLLTELDTRKAVCEWFPRLAWYRDIGSHVLGKVSSFVCACLVHSADGLAHLAVVATDRIEIRDLTTGNVFDQVAFAGEQVRSVVEIPTTGDIMLAFAYQNGDIALLDVVHRSLNRQNVGLREPEICVLAGGHELLLAVGQEDGQINIWSIPDLVWRARLDAHSASISFLASASLYGKPVLISGSDAFRRGEITETQQLMVWDAETMAPIRAFSGPAGSLVQWCALLELNGEVYLVAYYFPNRSFILHAMNTAKDVALLFDTTSRPFGMIKDGDGYSVFSGFSDVFSWIRIGLDSNNSPTIEATPNMAIEGGRWLGPVTDGVSYSVVSINNDVRVWNLQGLKDRANVAKEQRVGLLDQTGEPLFCLSAPADSQYFAGLSRYGNLRVWSAEGELQSVEQLVTSREGSGGEEFSDLQMVDFDGCCIYVLAGQNGTLQAWNLDAKPVMRRLKIDTSFASAFYIHPVKNRLIAIAAVKAGENYEISAWDLLRRVEITLPGRFVIEGYRDKTIKHLVALECAGRTVIVGALEHCICAWELDGPSIDQKMRRRRHFYGLSPRLRDALWTRVAEREITSIAVVHHLGAPAIAIGDVEGEITIIDAVDAKQLAHYKAHDKQVVTIRGARIGERYIAISAGREGSIVVANLSNLSVYPQILINIEFGDRICAMTVTSNGRAVIGTDRGFVLFELMAFDNPHSDQAP